MDVALHKDMGIANDLKNSRLMSSEAGSGHCTERTGQAKSFLEAESPPPRGCFCLICGCARVLNKSSTDSHDIAGQDQQVPQESLLREFDLQQKEPSRFEGSFNLLRQPTMTPVPESLEININSRDIEGGGVKFYAADDDDCPYEAGSDSGTLSGSPDGSESPDGEKFGKNSVLKNGSSLKEKFGIFLRRLSRRDSTEHILLHEPGNELELVTGPMSKEELAEISKFSGTWKLDRRASDPYSALWKLMELGNAFHVDNAASDVVKIACTAEEMVYIAQLVGLVNFVEHRPWSGDKVEHRRRDSREGRLLCSVQRYSRGMVLRSHWDDPFGGVSSEYLEMPADGMSLVIRMDVYRNPNSRAGKEAHLRLVFRRAK